MHSAWRPAMCDLQAHSSSLQARSTQIDRFVEIDEEEIVADYSHDLTDTISEM